MAPKLSEETYVFLHARPPELYLQVHLGSGNTIMQLQLRPTCYVQATKHGSTNHESSVPPTMDRSDGGVGDHLGSGGSGGETLDLVLSAVSAPTSSRFHRFHPPSTSQPPLLLNEPSLSRISSGVTAPSIEPRLRLSTGHVISRPVAFPLVDEPLDRHRGSPWPRRRRLRKWFEGDISSEIPSAIFLLSRQCRHDQNHQDYNL
ncbi:hypothetical protein B0H65DRAFT_21087 [Neurospora tetraspora]|uniref:Uncharacterized protein n=1 Tax=Neurospora tetraspora TaxID=94610 RepID=A0AAE0JND4_9PEZI|nr:hypothetical protein B0H65DRAFT_21087 [Neurospora tetraspora]